MASINFSLADLFQEAFGYKSEAFKPDFNDVKGFGNSLTDRKETGDYGAKYYKNDATGTEYYLPVSIKYPTSITLPDGSISSGPNVEIDLWHPVVSVKARKKIVETELTERNGPVLEFINRSGYEVNIKGIIINAANEFPEAQIKQLRDLWEYNGAVQLTCAETDPWLISCQRSVVIKDLSIPEMKGVKNVRSFELVCISNQPFNLIDIS